MNKTMKQRLVGAIVFGCLAIIFLPILLDGEGVSPPEMNIIMPAAPPIFPEPLEVELQRPTIISDTAEILIESGVNAGASAENDENTSNINQNTIADSPLLDAEGLPQAWSIRLGLFGDNVNAETLISELLEKDYRAYADSVITSQGELTAVLVGPVLTRFEAEALRAELSSSFNLEALIVDFSIDEAN